MSPTPRPSRKTQRVSPYPASHNTSNAKNGTTNTKPTLPQLPVSLEAFISNLVFAVFIQDDEEIANLIFDRSFSRNFDESANGTILSFEGHKEFAATIRRTIADRRLVTESFIVMPADPEGLTGTSAHNFQFTGVQAGEEVKTSVVVVETVTLNEKGLRQVKMASFVYRTDRV